ncbi:unnamed protein product [Schistosoma curassoni]|uniref:DUF4258 domain-containing protein n=1 Tax=Schistosoma curassoni TaxID=6186 RepID=A0A183JYC7_9TREM|nr:unnamed protein product [Schistosoma curassoni]
MSFEANKQKYVKELSTTPEEAEEEGNMKQLYDVAKKVEGKYGKSERQIKNKECILFTGVQGQRNRLVDYPAERLVITIIYNSACAGTRHFYRHDL